jgi:hypothetical protein
MSAGSDDVTRGVITAYLCITCPPFAVVYFLSGLPWWLIAALVLLGVVGAVVWGLVQFFKVLAAEVRARVVEVRETDWLDLIDDHEPGPEHPVRDDPRFEAGLTRMLGFDRQISQPQ